MPHAPRAFALATLLLTPVAARALIAYMASRAASPVMARMGLDPAPR